MSEEGWAREGEMCEGGGGGRMGEGREAVVWSRVRRIAERTSWRGAIVEAGEEVASRRK